ncbi:peptidase [Rhodopseudomonas palustris]|uniref:Peptidase n=1 Tax=Rhodopseudomonas palustris TaxID=1076 RepID=A0A323UCI7_RHOPL|nr:PepSY domain-containing protein [Rhodopseudomonas palustris]PZA10592.1 peptidase [Rhodopseudomonas palustris]
MRRLFILAFAAVIAAAPMPSAPVFAHDHGAHDRRHDHDQARLAVERGEIRPLAELLAMIRGKLPGEITGVEIERHHDQWLYEFIVVDKGGRLYEVYVDALSGEIRRTREK